MPNIIIIGAQWGDEGKGKIVDLLSGGMDAIVRFQGGNNAGHTIITGGEKTVLHLVPSGILHERPKCFIANGVVCDPWVFLQELDRLGARGVDVSPARIGISPKTHLIMPYHRALDTARETSLAGSKIGTTGRGIGPCYEDKVARCGLRAGDLADPEKVRRIIGNALREKNALLHGLYGQQAFTEDEIYNEIMAIAPRILPHLTDVAEELRAINARGGGIMFEGAQGTHLDIDHGTYPFVTSSNTVAGNAAAGCGIALPMHRIIGIAKAYVTRVGSGPFPSELFDEIGEHLQQKGLEFGATTGRKRRCGWLDLASLRESVRLNGLTEIAMTKLDVLQGLKTIKFCVGYEYQGKKWDMQPGGLEALMEAKPVYDELPGFSEDISACRSFENLPQNARNYISRVEKESGVPVSFISVGPDREQTILR